MHLELPLSRLTPSSLNPRKHFSEADLAELRDSIGKYGVLTNLIVRPTWSVGLITADDKKRTQDKNLFGAWEADGRPDFEIVSGERRFRAALLYLTSNAIALDSYLVPVRIKAMTDPEVLAINLTEQMQRSELTPLEEADAFAQLLAFRDEQGQPLHTAESIAASVDKAHDYVLRRLKLRPLPAFMKSALAAGETSATVAEKVARVPSEPEREEACKLALTGGRDGRAMTEVEVEAMLAEKFMVQLKGAPFDQEDAGLCDASRFVDGFNGKCSGCLHRTGNNKALYGDVKRGDVCTNPGCYRQKCAAAFAVLASEATAKGVVVLTDAESAKLFETHQPTTLRFNGDHVELDTRPLPHLLKAEVTNPPTWREIATRADAAGMNPKTVLAKDGAGRGRWLGDSALLMAASEKLGEPIFNGQGEDAPDVAPRPGEDANDTFNRGKREHAEKLKAEAEAAAEKKKNDALVRVAAVRAVYEALLNDWEEATIWNVLGSILLVPENSAACALAIEMLGMKPNVTEKKIDMTVRKMSIVQRQAMVPLLIIARPILDRGVLCASLRAIASVADVNLNTIERETLTKAKPAKPKKSLAKGAKTAKPAKAKKGGAK